MIKPTINPEWEKAEIEFEHKFVPALARRLNPEWEKLEAHIKSGDAKPVPIKFGGGYFVAYEIVKP